MSALQMQKIKNLKMFKVFVSMATKLSNRQNFYKNTVISKQIILLLQEIYEQLMHILKIPHMSNKCKKIKVIR